MVEISFAGDLSIKDKPRHDKMELSNNDILIIYTCVRHTEYDEKAIKIIIGLLLNKPTTRMPRVVAEFRDPNHPLTRTVAEVAEKTQDRLDELLRGIKVLCEPHVAEQEKRKDKERSWKEDREKEREEKERRKREREGPPLTESDLHIRDSQLPNIGGKRATKSEVLDIYAAVCLYKHEIRGAELRILLGDLIGKKDGPVKTIPPFVSDFIQGAHDAFTLEVERVTKLKNEELLARVDAAWQRSKSMALGAKGSARSRPSVSTSAPEIIEDFSQGGRPPVPSIRRAPAGPPAPEGLMNIGSFYGPEILVPADGRRQSTISQPPSQRPMREYGQDPLFSQVSESFQNQPEDTGLYGQQTTVSGENPAPGIRGLSISTSGRSESPDRVTTRRREDDKKARSKTAKGDSKKKADEGAGKKSGDSRQKKAGEDKHQAKKGHRTR